MNSFLWLLITAFSAVVGYLASQRNSKIYWQRIAAEQQATLGAELAATQSQLMSQRQANADLRYRLGEVEKTLLYITQHKDQS